MCSYMWIKSAIHIWIGYLGKENQSADPVKMKFFACMFFPKDAINEINQAEFSDVTLHYEIKFKCPQIFDFIPQ